MQSFILDRHTDPNNPTMKVTQDDKFPVYATEADAEADLANLEEGQIVGTKENGDGNRYVLQSDYTSDNTYSTSETFTGKYWIDGKKIYRKCYKGSKTSSGLITIDTISDLDSVLLLQQVYIGSQYIQSNYFASASNHMRAMIDKNTCDVVVESHTAITYTVIIEYTKTTD